MKPYHSEKSFIMTTKIPLALLFGLVSTGIVPIGAKGETWPVKVWKKANFFENRSTSFFKMVKKMSILKHLP